jgi:hypothetical protein
MADAESPSLRKLVASFERLHAHEVGDLNQGGRDDSASGIEISIWRTLLAQTEVARIVFPRTKRKRSNSTGEQLFTPPPSQPGQSIGRMKICGSRSVSEKSSEVINILQMSEEALDS